MWILVFAVGVVCGMPLGVLVLYFFAVLIDPSQEGDSIDKGDFE